MSIPIKGKFSTKHLLVDKNDSVILYAAAITIAVIIFAVVASVALGKQIAYQNKVISLRDAASKQLKVNITSADAIVDAYKRFESTKESVVGTAEKNPKIILDALPSKYDFPALATSLDALAKMSGVNLDSMSGVDNEATAEQDSVNPVPIEIPFQITASGSLENIRKLIKNIELSIRPIQILSIDISANDDVIQVNISAKTYYQPEKLLNVEQYVVGQDGKVAGGSGGIQ